MTNLKSLKLEKLTFDCLNLVSEVGRFIQDQQEQVTTEDILTKEQNSFVTFVDKQAEVQLITRLRKLLPKATFITEEDTVENEDSDLAWIVDPLDGTTNFLYGIPMYSISLALKAGSEVVIGIVHAIHQNETFYAWHQGGAYLNKKSIQVSQRQELMQALVGTGFPYNKQKRLEKPLKIMSSLLAQCKGIRRLGSAAMDLAYVASGRLDCYYESNLNAWDVAAGGKIVKEAGGVVTDYEQTEHWIQGESILAGNGILHQKLFELIRSV